MIIGVSLDDVLRDFLDKFKKVYKKEFDKDPIEPINTLDLLNHFPFETEDELYTFLYEDFSLELFGHANEKYKNAVVDLNTLYSQHKETHDFLIISKEIGNSIPATLFFLSKTSCKIRNYKFLNSYSSVWDYSDVMITANPDILVNKPETKISIKIKTDYNQEIGADYEIDKLKDVLESNMLSNLSNTKIITYTKI